MLSSPGPLTDGVPVAALRASIVLEELIGQQETSILQERGFHTEAKEYSVSVVAELEQDNEGQFGSFWLDLVTVRRSSTGKA